VVSFNGRYIVAWLPQVVIVPIVKKDTDRAGVDEAVGRLQAALKEAGIRVKVGGYRSVITQSLLAGLSSNP